MFTVFAEMDEFLVELDEDVEGMQSTIYFLQQQLKDSKDQVAQLQKENELLRTQQGATSSGGTSVAQDAAPRDKCGSDPVLHKVEASSSTATNNTDSRRFDHRTDPHNVVSNHNSEHRHSHLQTTNGSSHHVAMETDMSDGQQGSCDEATGSEEQAPTSHTLYRSHKTSKEVNSHAPSSSSRNYPPSTENTDATSSEEWSPQPSKQHVEGMVVDDDHSSVEHERTANKGGAHSGDVQLQNGLLAQAPYDSQDDDKEG